MRASSVATALAAFAAGMTASAALRRLAAHRAPAPAAAAPACSPDAVTGTDRDAVVLPFSRPVPVPAPARPAGPARCGDSGGRTKAGAPCAARAAAGGRCHHHPLAA
ncbi:hypothetical protein JOD57_000189 [Geodermatophilus bullaregiensis]|uniref:hypothetical protein n=1 Tax=Geodermatophilus bullaregiensis TaxID=1564160 RepID=UPI0019572F6E|nr:hypothetical protein [Geodermatophilus bullaregiensis]MBM7804352.1 hypothetical protein [Geodermatophilus bullaregiensis]